MVSLDIPLPAQDGIINTRTATSADLLNLWGVDTLDPKQEYGQGFGDDPLGWSTSWEGGRGWSAEQALQRRAELNSALAREAAAADPWSEFTGYGRLHGEMPMGGWGGDVYFAPAALPTNFTRSDVARGVAQNLGLDADSALDLYAQGMRDPNRFSLFAGASDVGNAHLLPGWGIAHMLRETGNWDDAVAQDLAMWVDQGYQEMNARREADKRAERASLGQFVGMLGGLAFAPFAFGGSEMLGSLGGRLAGGAANVLGSAIGGGNPLPALAGAVGGPLSDLAGGSLQSVFSGLGPTGAKIADNVVRSLGVSALQQTANTGRIDPTALLMAAAPGAADTAFDAMGGWSGMFGGGGAAQGWTSGYDLPMGQIAPYAEQMRVFGNDSPEAFSTPGMMPVSLSPERQQLDALFPAPTNISEVASVVPGSQTGRVESLFPLARYAAAPPAPSLASQQAQMSLSPERERLDELFPPPAEPATSENLLTPDEGMMSPVPEAPAGKPWYDNIKPSALIKLGVTLAGLIGADDAMADQGRAIAEAEYATEEQRRQAYLDYANRVFGAIPEIADAYDPKFFAENSAMGRVEIDPATGEARYIMTPEAQASVDKMIDAADKVMSQILETDVTKLSETEFQKKLETLQGKRDADLAKLLRVLYARGMLGVATYEGAGTDLITGRTESFALQPGQEANPFLGAYMAGVERENAALSGQSMNDAQNFIDRLLGESTGLADEITGAQNSMLDAILGAGSRYAARNAGEQARGNALSQLLESPAGLFADRLGPQELAMALARQNEEEELRKRSAGMMGGM